jgi:hypothetical protein
MPNGAELPDDAIVYRRIPAANGWVSADGKVDFAAFLPNNGDGDGLSLSCCATAAEAAATGKSGKQFYAVRLSVADLKAKGLRIVGDSPDHAVIDGWTTPTRKNKNVRDLAMWMTSVCGPAEGPFDGQWTPPPEPPDPHP